VLNVFSEMVLVAKEDRVREAKYGNQGSWLPMFLRAPATETTLRLDALNLV
jgi:hypothetical protein